MKTTLEIEIKNGKKTFIDFTGSIQEFIDKLQFLNDTAYYIDREGWYIIANQIARFKPTGETNV
jgi:hypothetical protein